MKKLIGIALNFSKLGKTDKGRVCTCLIIVILRPKVKDIVSFENLYAKYFQKRFQNISSLTIYPEEHDDPGFIKLNFDFII